MNECEVLIIGLGPSGMFLANEMQKYGINYLAIDKREAISNITRAVNLTPSSLATLKFSLQMNVIDSVKKKELIKVYWEGKQISRFSHKFQKFPYRQFCYLPQPNLEKLFYERLHSTASSVWENTELISINVVDEGYIVELRNKDAKKIFVKCKYLLGCDGNNSFVRNWANIQNENEDYNSKFVLFDIETSEAITEDSNYYLSEKGYIIIVPIAKNTYRIILSLNNLNADLETYNSIPFLTDVVNKYCEIDIEIKRINWFTHSDFRHRIAKSCHENTLFLVGDSFHIFSPVGGLNLSTGIQDSANLGWKLAYVIKKYANKSILSTYANERSFVVNEIKDKTRHLTKVITNAKSYLPAKNYISNLNNKIYLKKGLSQILSGYNNYFNKSEIKAKSHFKVGHHFSEFISDRNIYESMCEVLDSKKFNLLINEKLSLDLKVNEYFNYLALPDLDLKDLFLLIRPDGYIQKIGNVKDILEIPTYLSKFLGAC